MAGTARLELRGLADAVRHRPLGGVAPLPGYRPDPTWRSRWHRRADRNKAFERDIRV